MVSTSDHSCREMGGIRQVHPIRVSSLLAQGFTDGKLQIGNVYNNETFVIWGSSTLGDPGQQIGGSYTSSSNLIFISIADFSNYKFISVGAL